MATQSPLPPLLRIPLEIRLLIYKELLFLETDIKERQSNLVSLPDYYEYEKSENAPSYPGYMLCFRHIGPPHFTVENHQENKCRSMYKIRSDRFRARCVDVTYGCVNVPQNLDVTVLKLNRQIHDEAARVLYSSYTFDFDTNIEACTPFLHDLTPFARSCLRRLSIVKRALPYDKHFDRCEWTSMCKRIQNELSLTSLSLGIVAGKPLYGTLDIRPFEENEYNAILDAKEDEMMWVRDLIRIQGLQQLDIRACIEHCPPPGSNAMGFFVAFSASVENGFRSYLTSKMIPNSKATATSKMIASVA